jgi:hypothetical protein
LHLKVMRASTFGGPLLKGSGSLVCDRACKSYEGSGLFRMDEEWICCGCEPCSTVFGTEE